MMKKILLILLILSIFLLTGCAIKPPTDPSNQRQIKWKAIINLPDGTVVKGDCSEYARASGNWIWVTVNNIKYRINDWRVVIIEE